MKHLILMTAMLCVSFYGSSQDEEARSWIVGTTFNFSHDVSSVDNIDRDQTTNRFSIQPSLAKIINPKWTLGLSPGYSTTTYKNDAYFFGGQQVPSSKRNSNAVSVSVFARYTLNPENKFNVFLRPHMQLSGQKSKTRQNGDITSELNSSNWSVGLRTGLLYQLSKRFNVKAILGGLSYSSSVSKDQLGDSPDQKSSRFGLNFWNSVGSVGFEYKF